MKERAKFIGMYYAKEWSISALCRHFGISRKTAYKWIDRFEANPTYQCYSPFSLP